VGKRLASSFASRRASVTGRSRQGGRPPGSGDTSLFVLALRCLQGGEALLVVARLEEVRGRHPVGDEGARPADRVLLTQEVGPHDLEDAPDAFRRVEPRQVIGDRDGALLAPAQASHAACLGDLRGPLGVVGEAVGTLVLGWHLARLAVRSGEAAAAAGYHRLALVTERRVVTAHRPHDLRPRAIVWGLARGLRAPPGRHLCELDRG
jgi:hypothetical protein